MDSLVSVSFMRGFLLLPGIPFFLLWKTPSHVQVQYNCTSQHQTVPSLRSHITWHRLQPAHSRGLELSISGLPHRTVGSCELKLYLGLLEGSSPALPYCRGSERLSRWPSVGNLYLAHGSSDSCIHLLPAGHQNATS